MRLTLCEVLIHPPKPWNPTLSRHPLLDEFDFYWRVEPGVKFFCKLRQVGAVLLYCHGKENLASGAGHQVL